MPNDYGSPGFQPPDPTRQQPAPAPPSKSVVQDAMTHRPNTGTRPAVQPVRGQSYSKDPTYVNHSVKVDEALDDSGA